MTALRDFQAEFGAFLAGDAGTDSLGIGPGLEAHADIYRNNVRSAHVTTLGAVYPAVRALVGDAYFDQLAEAFALASPPASAILSAYGHGFADRLAAQAELADFPFLPGVARLEWALNETFHAHSSLSLTPDAAAAMFAASDGDVQLEPMPSLRLVTGCYDLREIRLAALAGEPERIASLGAEPHRFAVFQSGSEVRIEPLSPGEFALLAGLGDGKANEAALADAIQGDDGFSPGEAVGRLLHLGVFRAPTFFSKGT